MANNYVPALRFKALTKLYDSLLSATFQEKKIKQALVNQLQLKGTETILDFGCGTGTLAIMIKDQFPSVNIIGIDVDAEIIGIAEKKIKAKGLSIHLKKFDGESLAFFGHQQFDRIVSSLVFHHIPTTTKRTILSQLYRITKPGGELHIADFGKPKNLYTKAAFGLLRRFDGVENTSVNAEGLLHDFIKGGGFKEVQITQSFNTAFGTVDLIKAKDAEAPLRKIEFAKHQNENLRLWATGLRDVVWNAVEDNLEARNSAISYLPSDNGLFTPFIDAYAAGSIIHPFSSFFADLGKRIYREVVIEYENKNNIRVNKEHLFIAISFLSIQSGDEITAMQFWEMAQKEQELTHGTAASLDGTIDLLHTKFRTVINAIELNYNENELIKNLRPKFPFIKDFETTLKSLGNLSKAHFLSCGIKHVHVLGKLRESKDLSIIKVFAQELVNSLCVLNENLLKEKGLSGDTINPLMVAVYNSYPAVGHHLGQSNSATGIYRITKAEFYGRLNDYINFIETHVSDPDKLKADTLHALHRLRNEALHTLDDTRLYYSDIALFEKTIGLLFICVSVIKSL
jgi:ubiquinone/menaquinone biosynthesis C-methylase UbiE